MKLDAPPAADATPAATSALAIPAASQIARTPLVLIPCSSLNSPSRRADYDGLHRDGKGTMMRVRVKPHGRRLPTPADDSERNAPDGRARRRRDLLLAGDRALRGAARVDLPPLPRRKGAAGRRSDPLRRGPHRRWTKRGARTEGSGRRGGRHRRLL